MELNDSKAWGSVLPKSTPDVSTVKDRTNGSRCQRRLFFLGFSVIRFGLRRVCLQPSFPLGPGLFALVVRDALAEWYDDFKGLCVVPHNPPRHLEFGFSLRIRCSDVHDLASVFPMPQDVQGNATKTASNRVTVPGSAFL